MRMRFARPEQPDLVEAYCKANGLSLMGNTAYPRVIARVYSTISVLWCAATGVFALWSLLHNSRWFGTGLVVFVVGYAVLFFSFQFKYGISRDKIEEEVAFMQRMNRR